MIIKNAKRRVRSMTDTFDDVGRVTIEFDENGTADVDDSVAKLFLDKHPKDLSRVSKKSIAESTEAQESTEAEDDSEATNQEE